MKKLLIFMLVGLMAVFALACKESSTGNDDDHDDHEFSEAILPILGQVGDILGESGVMPPGASLDSYNDVMAGWDRGELVIPYDVDRSLLIELLTKVPHATSLDEHDMEDLEHWIEEGCLDDHEDKPFAGVQNKLYVASQNSALINIIDPENMVVIKNIDLTLPENGGLIPECSPHHIAVSPDGAYWYVSTINPGVQTVLKFDASNDSLMGTVETNIPALLAHHPTENVLYVSRFMNPDVATPDIFVCDTENMQPISQGGADNGDIAVLSAVPHGLAMGKSGDYVYVASLAESNVMVVDHDSKEMVHVVDLGTGKSPLQIAESPTDPLLFVSCVGTHQFFVVDVTDPTAAAVVDSISLGDAPGGPGMGPWHPVFTHDGQRMYIGNNGSDNIMQIDTQSYSVIETITGNGLAQPHGSAISANGQYIYISSRNITGAYAPYFDLGDNANIGTVVALNTSDNSIEKIIEIENFGSGMFMAQ